VPNPEFRTDSETSLTEISHVNKNSNLTYIRARTPVNCDSPTGIHHTGSAGVRTRDNFAAEQSTERTPAPALAGHPDTARQLMEWARQAPAYPEMQWNDGQRSDQVVSVGPDSDCDYSNLQDAIRDAADGPHFQFGVHVDYEFSERYVIEDPHEWMGSPWLIGGFPSCDVSDPAPDHPSRTVLDADGQGRVFQIDSSAGEDDLVRSVQLDRFVLKGGSANRWGRNANRRSGGPTERRFAQCRHRRKLRHLGRGHLDVHNR